MTKDCHHAPPDAQHLVDDMNSRIAILSLAHGSNPSFLYSMNETGVFICMNSGTTLHQEGATRVTAMANDDKKALTVLLTH